MFVCLTLAAAASGCGREPMVQAGPAAAGLDAACRVALAPVAAGPLANEITAQQRRVGEGEGAGSAVAVERLGYLFVARARLSHDDGLYDAALEAAACLERRDPANDQARLLRGHVLHQQHRFKEAERIARRLVEARGLAVDFGLLGDTLMEQGDLDGAERAYQRMIDLKPFYQSYTRAAHLRWLRGRLDGAIALMEQALSAASPRDPEAVVWARVRLAHYYLQAGRRDAALEECQAALATRPGYAPALVAFGRIHLARGDRPEALDALRDASAADANPETLWLLADVLRASKRDAEAGEVEARLAREGSLRDPRTVSLFLATRREAADRAVDLARRELAVRGDVFTHDALAWALARSGRIEEARPHMAQALSAGTADGRLLMHGAAVAAESGDAAGARRLLGRARALAHTLLPSERAALADADAALARLVREGPGRQQERTNP
jgi:tetratricopeptide (TPR) repeat protein